MNNFLADILDGIEEVEPQMHNQFKLPTVLIDTSYCTYYAMFSAWKIFKENYSELIPTGYDHNYDPGMHNEYLDIFKSRFEYAATGSVLKQCSLLSQENFIFAKDCAKENIWRISIYPEYKQKRRDAKKEDKEFSFNLTFKYLYNTILPEYEEYGSKVIGVECCEGDDIIATIINNNPDKLFYIVASDRDLLQLTNDKVRMFSAGDKEITYESELELNEDQMKHINSDSYILIKAIFGDSSDGISAIHNRCGIKTAIKYFFDRTKLDEAFNKFPEAKTILKKNLSIMDFKYIPKEINDAIMKKFNTL